MENILFCKNCNITGNNTLKYKEFGFTQNALNFMRGYIGTFDGEIDNNNNPNQCPFCNNILENTGISVLEFREILSSTNYNRDILDAMIKLKKADIVEYNIKLNQFKIQSEQLNKTIKQTKPHCPHCNSTNIKPLSGLNRGVSIAMWGVFSKKINKSFECIDCKYTW